MQFIILVGLLNFIGSQAQILENYYAVVIDAGSTGSRSFVFNISSSYIYENENNDSEVGKKKRKVDVYTGEKVRPGLSTFADNPLDSIEYIIPLFVNAASIIPKQFHNSTQVFIKGTAGMRLLEQHKQEVIWDSLAIGLANNHLNKFNFPFQINRSNIGTINGYQEAYYAVLSSNYIDGSIDGDLQ
jgi:Golgi nucleoside diphosphatase